MTMDEMDEIETGEWVKEGASAPWVLGKKHTPSLTTPYIPFLLDDGSLLVLGAVWGRSTKQGPSDRLPGSSLCFGMDPPSSHPPFLG